MGSQVGSWPSLAKTEFGQTDFGQTDFDLLCVVCGVWCVVCCVCVCVVWCVVCVWCVCVCVCCVAWVLVSRFHGVGFHVWVLVSRFWFSHVRCPDRPSRDRPSRDRPSRDRPSRDRPSRTPPPLDIPLPDPPSAGPPKFRFFFSLARYNFHSFFPLFGVHSLKFGGVFEGRDPEMCTFGLSGCRVKPRRLFQGPGASNTTKIPRKDPKEREEEKNNVAGEGKKPRNFGPPTLRGLTLLGSTPHPPPTRWPEAALA